MNSSSSHGWRAEEVDLKGLIEHVTAGHAFAPQYKGEHRKGTNFICASFFAADVDDGVTLEEARDNAFINSYAACIYTTASHTNERHRFRVVFVAETAVELGQDYADINLALAFKIGGDLSTSDKGRCFFGSRSAQVWKPGHVLPSEVMDNLLKSGRELRSARSGGFAVNSARRVESSLPVKLADGSVLPLCDVPVGASVHCPYHDDRRPSAFIVPSWTRGGVGTHTDMDQQLSRVRNPGTIKVWISPARFHYSSNFDVIRDDLARARYAPGAVKGYTADGLTKYDPSHPLLMIYIRMVSTDPISPNCHDFDVPSRSYPREGISPAGANCTLYQQMMPAGRRDLERALCTFLALDVAQVERIGFLLMHPRLRPRQHLRAFEMVGDLDQRMRRHDLDVRARPGRFRAASRRADQAFLARIGPDRRREHARHGRDRTVQPEFAEHGEAAQSIGGNGADRRHQPERDRQIVMAAFLRQVRGREIDRDSPRGQRQPRGDQRRAHPLARLGHRLVGEAYDGERRQPGRDLDLHVDRAGLDPLKGYGGNALDQMVPLCRNER
jgi:hypothetical protein